MSKIILQSSNTGTGNITISAPVTNEDRTLTLPDNSGTLLNNASTAGFPAGTVLQVITRTLDGTTQSIPSTTNTVVQLTGWSQTINKIRSDSTVVCFMNFCNYIDSGGSGWWFLSCKVGSDPVSSSNQYGVLSHNPSQFTFSASAHQFWHGVWHDTRDQSTITYDFFHNSSGSRSMVWWNNPVNWVFFEVAA